MLRVSSVQFDVTVLTNCTAHVCGCAVRPVLQLLIHRRLKETKSMGQRLTGLNPRKGAVEQMPDVKAVIG